MRRSEGNTRLTGLLALVLLCLPVTSRQQIFQDGFENLDPVILSEAVLTAEPGVPYSYDVDAIDSPGEVLVYKLLRAPPGMQIDAQTGAIAWTPVFVGFFEVEVLVTDEFGGMALQAWTITVDAGPDSDNDLLSDALEEVYGTDPGDPDTDGDGLTDGAEVLSHGTDPLNPDSDGDGLADGEEINSSSTDPLLLDSDGDGFGDGLEIEVGTDPLDVADFPAGPVDPAAVATEHDPTVPTAFSDSVAFLWNGNPPIQTGVTPDAIDAQRVIVLQGKVMDQAGDPLPGATISVLHHPELGQTQSRVDGRFNLAVNGGGAVTIEYRLAGRLPAQRQVQTPWRDYVQVPDVALLPLDPNVTEFDLGSDVMGVAQGSVISDAEGDRQATVMCPVGTTAELVFPDGSTQQISTLSVRATEYTVGDMGPMAMPAMLPPTSAYTYAVELSADEALAVGASDVMFSQPLPFYVENFLGFPVGTPVPTGYYDANKAAWVASDNGLVIGIVGETGGLADVDLDGDNVADTGQALSDLGITDDERQNLANVYDPGQSLWRVPIAHFTPWDHNWGFGPPADARDPRRPRPTRRQPQDRGCNTPGSILNCQDQALGERLSIPGTSLSMHYQSDRMPGNVSNRQVEISLSGDTLPASLKRIDLDISVAGQHHRMSFPPDPNQTTVFTWNGLDAFGREANAGATMSVKIGYPYDGQYEVPERFGYNGNGIAIEGNKTRREVSLVQKFQVEMPFAFNPFAQGLGAWSLNVHHVFSEESQILYLGDGTQRNASDLGLRINTVVGALGNQTRFVKPEGVPAEQFRQNPQTQFAVDAEGVLHLIGLNQIVKLVDGMILPVAGTGKSPAVSPLEPEGVPATEANIAPQHMVFGPDGSLYFDENANCRIRRIDPQGIVRNVAGVGCTTDQGVFNFVGGPALSARFRYIDSLDVAADGTVYTADGRRVFAIPPDGRLVHIAGQIDDRSTGDGGPATQATGQFFTVRVGPAGNIFVRDSCRVRRIDTSGIITTVVGTPTESDPRDFYGCGTQPEGSLATGEVLGSGGNLEILANGDIIATTGQPPRVYLINGEGKIFRLAGTGGYDRQYAGDKGSALQARMFDPLEMAVDPEGTIYIDDQRSQVIRSLKASFESLAVGANRIVASQDGGELYVFDIGGRHLRTISALTGATIWSFKYRSDGLLESLTDGDGNALVIERDQASNPKALVGPFGHRTLLTTNAMGYLTSVTAPGGEQVQMAYGPGGLLEFLVRPDQEISTYAYDSAGRLIRADDGSGFVTEFSRVELDLGYEVTRTSGMGVTSTYRVERLPSGDTLMTNTDAAGAQVRVTLGRDGSQSVAWPGGESDSQLNGADPRFGSNSLGSEVYTATTPGGKTLQVESWREVELADPHDLLSLNTVTERRRIGSRTMTEVYDSATRTYTRTTPAGRISTLATDTLGRATAFDLDPVIETRSWTYDTRGQLSRVEQGGKSIEYEYDDLGRVVLLTDARGREQSYSYDAADRLVGLVTPASRGYAFSYDAMGRMLSVTMPGGQVHELDYAAFGGLVAYTPPGADPMTQDYDLDHRRTGVGLADGREQVHGFDAAHRSDETTYPEATVAYSYQGVTHQFDTISWTPTSGPPHSQSFTYDGDLLTGTTLTYDGVDDTFAYSHDGAWRLSGIQLNAEPAWTLAYDDDDLPTAYGPFTVERNGPAGAPSRYADSSLVVDFEYDSFGRLARRTHSVNGSVVYDLQLSRLAGSDLVAQRIETVNGSATTQEFEYSLDGELTAVSEGVLQVEDYAYDLNGNRTAANGTAATYDAQDRLQSRGAVDYGFDANGFLAGRGSNTFTYSARGELLSAAVGGETVTYTYDAVGRRVARTHGGGTTQYLYGDPVDPFRLLASRDPGGMLTRYYYDQAGLLIGLERGGERFYVITDQVGSPRLVVDGTGAVQREIIYNSFGEIVVDTGSFDLAIGFAGGLVDPVTGLVRFGFRDYEPESGRWTSRDPILFRGGQFNLYAYAHNNPVGLRDPSGLLCLGFSAYAGPGAGGKLCFKDGKWSLCGEIGLGAGGGLSLDVLGGTSPPADADYFSADFSLGCGPASLNVGGKINDCGDLTITGGLQFSAGGLGLGNRRTRNLTTNTTTDVNFGDGPPGTGASINKSLLETACPDFKDGCPNPLGGDTKKVTDPDDKGKISCKAQASIKGGWCTGSDFF